MKKLNLAVVVALLLSVMPVQATNISGVAGNNGVYNITPEKINGDVGFRQYKNFNLSEGDIANLIFNKAINGQNGNIESFVNLVNNKVNINGILNTVQNGEYYNGNAIFITPGGFAVGSSGVLNVGSLSVGTPTVATYNNLLNQYAKGDLQGINKQVPDLVSNIKGNAGAANINIQGKVLARKGVNMTGKNVDVSGTVVNGVVTTEGYAYDDDVYDVVIKSNNQAEQLFRSLVNTKGLLPSSSGDNEFHQIFGNGGSQVYIKSTKGMNISGTVDNGDGSLYLTNTGNKGLTVTGTVDSTKEANLFNTSGNLKVDDRAYIEGRYTGVNITNTGKNLTLGENTKVESVKNIEVTNNGSGRLTALGKLLSGNEINNTEISNINITNNGSGMKIGGLVVNSDETAYPHIHQDMHEPGNGNINITNNKGDLALDARIINYDGDTKINNYGKGAMTVDGSIHNNRNIEIINRNGSRMIVNGNIENYNSDINAGNLKIVNHSGSGLTIGENATIKNEGGKLYIQNESGLLNINGKLSNFGELTNHGYNLDITSKRNSNGIKTGANSLIINEGTGNIAITHEGSGKQGLNLNGSIINQAINQDRIDTTSDEGGKILISNSASGNMNVNGKISTIGNLDIINKMYGNNTNVNADITVVGDNTQTNIEHTGKGNMTVGGKIDHYGKLKILDFNGQLNLNGKIINNGKDMTYAVSRNNGTGINVANTFSATAKNGGSIMIKNISGANGLKFAGDIKSTGQAELNNQKGNLVLSGTIKGNPTIIRNTGNNLIIKSKIDSKKAIETINSGKTFDLKKQLIK